MASLFDKLYGASEEVSKGIKKPFVLNKVKRALDGAADSYESDKIDAQEQIDDLMGDLANGDTEVIDDLIEARLELSEIEAHANEAKAIKAELAALALEDEV